MPSFVPTRALIARDALGYPLGARLADAFADRKIPVTVYDGRIPSASRLSCRERYLQKFTSESLGIHPGDEAFQSPACSPLPCSLVAF